MTGLSKRIAAIEESQTLALTARAAGLKAKGIDVANLSAGEPDFPTPAHVREAAIRAINEHFTHYTANNGIAPLREAIAEKFRSENGMNFKPSQILVSCGAKHSIFNALHAICDEGDEVIVQAPYWVSYPEMVKMAGGTPVIVRGEAGAGDDGFFLTPDLLRRAITSKTKALILNSPSNPTGAVYSAGQLSALAEVIGEARIYVISDEIYEKIIYDGSTHASIGSFDAVRDLAVTVNGVSKAYAMTGWRIGYMGGPADLIAASAKVQSQATSNANSIAQRAALAAIGGPDGEVRSMVSEFRKRRDYMVARVSAIPGMTISPPQGAFYLFPHVSGCIGLRKGGISISSDHDLSAYLMDEAHVAVVPGTPFGAPGHLRMSYACSIGEIEKAMDRIASAVGSLGRD